jgi:putative membrane protein
MSAKPHPIRGILAGAAAGLVASWVMNEFIAGPGKQLTKTIETPEEQRRDERQAEQRAGEPDATMKVADRVTETVTGGRHLTWEQQQQGGPIVHYTFGALAGAVYGGLAEYSPAVRSGFGTSFGSVLFSGADLLAVPALKLSAPLSETPSKTLASPFAAHLVYGVTTELFRRIVRTIL